MKLRYTAHRSFDHYWRVKVLILDHLFRGLGCLGEDGVFVHLIGGIMNNWVYLIVGIHTLFGVTIIVGDRNNIRN